MCATVTLQFGRYQSHTLETPHKAYHFEAALTQMSIQYNLAVVKFAQIFILGHFSCFQHTKFKNWLFPCCLIHPTTWHVPLLWEIQMLFTLPVSGVNVVADRCTWGRNDISSSNIQGHCTVLTFDFLFILYFFEGCLGNYLAESSRQESKT